MKTASQRQTYRNIELVKHLTEELHLLLHLRPALVPEAGRVGLFESDGSGLLQGRHAAVADARVRAGNVLDQVLGANQVPDTPPGGVEGLARGADGERALVQLGRHCGDAGEGDVEEAVVDLIGEDDEVVLDAQVANALEFLT